MPLTMTKISVTPLTKVATKIISLRPRDVTSIMGIVSPPTAIPNAPAISDLAIDVDNITSVDISFTVPADTTVKLYKKIAPAAYTVHEDNIASPFTVVGIDTSLNTYDFKVTTRGDGIVYTTQEINSNEVSTTPA